MAYIDSHAHLTGKEYQDDLKEIIADFKLNAISRVLLICCDDQDYRYAISLQEEYGCFDIAKGVHPENADEDRSVDLINLDKQLAAKKIAVVGEIGLDYYWTKATKDYQKALFIAQIQLADKYNLPIAVHSREASEDTYSILKEHHQSKRGVMHCYSGSVEMMERYVALGYYISLAGPVTFANAKVAKNVAIATPLDKLLYETDCPYLTPVPYRGKRNNPNFVVYTARMIAELRGISVEELNQAVKINYATLLGSNNA